MYTKTVNQYFELPCTNLLPPLPHYPLTLTTDWSLTVFKKNAWKFIFYTITEAHKQYSLLDAIFNYIFYFGPPGKNLSKNQENLLLTCRPASPFDM